MRGVGVGGGNVSIYWGEMKCTQSFGGETRREEPLGEPRCKCGDSIETTEINRLLQCGLGFSSYV